MVLVTMLTYYFNHWLLSSLKRITMGISIISQVMCMQLMVIKITRGLVEDNCMGVAWRTSVGLVKSSKSLSSLCKKSSVISTWWQQVITSLKHKSSIINVHNDYKLTLWECYACKGLSCWSLCMHSMPRKLNDFSEHISPDLPEAKLHRPQTCAHCQL